MYGYRKKCYIMPRMVEKSRRKERAITKSDGERLAELERDIIKAESAIQAAADEFKHVREQMMLGIVCEDGVEAEDKIVRLNGALEDLRRRREELVGAMDTQLLKSAVGEQRAGEIKSSGESCCDGGCDPDGLVSINGSDVCQACGCIFKCVGVSDSKDAVPFGEYRPGEATTTIIASGYRPWHHFSEKLAQFQGKQRARPPKEIVDAVQELCVQYKIPKRKITPSVVREFLKQRQQWENAKARFSFARSKDEKPIKYTDYYKYETIISHMLSGIPPPYMTPMQQARVTSMFLLIISSYKSSPRYLRMKKDSHNRKKRVDQPNNMNNYYTLYKICQTLGYDEFLPYIQLPKNIGNIDDNDENGWKHICEKNGITYTPTR